MQELINNFPQTPGLTLIAAFIAGILVALNPCQIAICISTLIFFIDNGDGSGQFARKTVLFAIGRAVSYLLLAIILILAVKFFGFTIDSFSSNKLTDAVDSFLPYIIMALAGLFLYRAVTNHHHNGSCHSSSGIIKKHKKNNIFLIGFILALIFCPESAVIYFGVMIPMAVLSRMGILVASVFSIAAILPLIIISMMSRHSNGKFAFLQNKLENLQKFINYVSAALLFCISIFLFVFQ